MRKGIHAECCTATVGKSGVRCLGQLDLSADSQLHIEAAPTPLQHGQVGVLVSDGTVVCQQSSGTLSHLRLHSHDMSSQAHVMDTFERQKGCFLQALALNRFALAFKIGLALNSRDLWLALGRRSLECLDIAWAKKAYRQAPAPGMVMYLDKIQTVEDKLLLSGHVSALFGNFAKAREYFLQSCSPETALDMHCDFLEWDQALQLAQTYAPHRLSDIYLKSALQLEGRNQNEQALSHYEMAMRDHIPGTRPEHESQCKAGIARTSVKMGDLPRGMQMALDLNDPTVCRDCAAVLHKMKQYVEAAQLYEAAGSYDQAASLYILDLNFDAAAPLMAKISTPKLHLQFAKAKESRGAYQDALVAYERARDLDSMVRICLDNLNQPQKAWLGNFLKPFQSWEKKFSEQTTSETKLASIDSLCAVNAPMRANDQRIKSAKERREDGLELFKRGDLISADEAFGEAIQFLERPGRADRPRSVTGAEHEESTINHLKRLLQEQEHFEYFKKQALKQAEDCAEKACLVWCDDKSLFRLGLARMLTAQPSLHVCNGFRSKAPAMWMMPEDNNEIMKDAGRCFQKALKARPSAASQQKLDEVKRWLAERNVTTLYPEYAFQLVRETKLATGAERVAEYCRKNGNISGAVEFLLLAKNTDEAFLLAERQDEMATFEAGLGDHGTQQQHRAIAKYYEQRNLLANAAKHYALCEEYPTALRLYLKVGEKEIDHAIEVVGKARNDSLTHTLIDYLMGETDNVPKDANYVYRLHKALGNYMQAAGTAHIIAKQEQEMGNYKQAHQLLFRTYQDLKSQKLALPQELWRRLMLLHSYVIVKRLVKAADHHSAAIIADDGFAGHTTQAVASLYACEAALSFDLATWLPHFQENFGCNACKPPCWQQNRSYDSGIASEVCKAGPALRYAILRHCWPAPIYQNVSPEMANLSPAPIHAYVPPVMSPMGGQFVKLDNEEPPVMALQLPIQKREVCSYTSDLGVGIRPQTPETRSPSTLSAETFGDANLQVEGTRSFRPLEAHDYESAMTPEKPIAATEPKKLHGAAFAKRHPGRNGPRSAGEGLPMRGPPPFCNRRRLRAGKCGPRFQP
eukprot:s2815_g6.t2